MHEVQSRSETILQNQARQPTAQVQSVGYDWAQLASEMRDGLNSVKRDIGAAVQRMNAQPLNSANTAAGGCPQPNCVSLSMFLVFGTIQLIILLGYSIYK